MMKISLLLALAAVLLLGACNRRADAPRQVVKDVPAETFKKQPGGVMEPILGVVDVPARGGSVKGSTRINGWALAKSGVETVGIYIDRQFISYATVGEGRPDVAKAYPMFPGGATSGWYTVIDFATMLEGDHLIQLQVTTKAGNIQDLPTIPFKVLK